MRGLLRAISFASLPPDEQLVSPPTMLSHRITLLLLMPDWDCALVATVAPADEPSRDEVIGRDLVDQSKNDFVDYTRSGQVGYESRAL